MDGNWLQRTELLIGSEGLARLQSARVAILGLGGVGSAAAEALCRAGVGHLLLIDHDQSEPAACRYPGGGGVAQN